MAEERREHRWSNTSKLHDASDDDFRQWLDIPRGGDEHGRDDDQRSGHIDGQRRSGGANDRYPTSKPDGDSGADR
jgi:hypothetical protein